MTDCTPAALKALLQQWFDERQQALREQMLQALSHDPDRWIPEDFLERIQAAAAPPEARDTDTELGVGLDRLGAAETQGEVLKRLLEAILPFGGRTALFILKQGLPTLYAQRGFEAGQPRPGTTVAPPAELEQLIQGAMPCLQTPGPAYQALLEPLRSLQARGMRILPLRLRRKTVALLLVDSGTEEALAYPNHVRALALGAEARLSFLGRGDSAPQPAAPAAEPSQPAQPLDPVVRTNAERSARVLVDDLELYFPAKITQGQNLGNLYESMKDELDRSWGSFVERYGNELESQHQIFYKAVVHQLCAGDPSRLGPAPWAAR
jgi:hypothetical protein